MKKIGIVAFTVFLLVSPLFASAYDRGHSDRDDRREEARERLEKALRKECEQLAQFIQKNRLKWPLPQFCKNLLPQTPPAPKPPSVTLSANPVKVISGATTTLAWQSTDATRCDASSNWNGQKALSGNEIVTVTATTTYAISCGNGVATTSAQATVNALQQPIPPPVVVTSGIISISTNPSSPNYQIAAGGTTGVTLGVLRFRATNENANLYRVGLQLTSGTPADVSTVYLYSSAGPLLGTATFIGNNTHATSTFFSPLTLVRDTDVLVTVKGDISQVQPAGGATSGDLLKIAIDANGTNTQGAGANSGSIINAVGTGEFAGVRILKSYPTVALDTLSSTGVLDGRLIRFKVTAGSFGSIGIAQFPFTVIATNATLQNAQVFAFTDSAYSQPVSGQGSGGQVGSTIANPGASVVIKPASNSVVIPAGTTYYFELRAAVSGVSAASSVVTTLRGDLSFDGMKTANTVAGNFIWSPHTSGTSVFTDADFTNGFGVPGLPPTGITRTRTN